MATTTIRLPDDLKERVARAAEAAGTSSHGFIVQAIAEKTEAAERRADFIAEAHARYERILQGEPTIPWEEEKKRWLANWGKGKPRAD
jgi:predicted transcriptional regulator